MHRGVVAALPRPGRSARRCPRGLVAPPPRCRPRTRDERETADGPAAPRRGAARRRGRRGDSRAEPGGAQGAADCSCGAGPGCAYALARAGYARPGAMTGLDLIIAGVVALLALYGWPQGFVAGALSLAGFALGAVLGTRLGPLCSPTGPSSPVRAAVRAPGRDPRRRASRGRPWRRRAAGARVLRRFPGLGALDGLLGRAAHGAVGLGVAGSSGRSRCRRPRSPACAATSSAPRSCGAQPGPPPSGPLLNSLARFDPFPPVDGPGVDLRAPRGGDRARPRGGRGGRERREDPRHGLRPGRGGLGVGRGRRPRGHERPRRGRPGGHAGAPARRGPRPRRHGRRLRPPQRRRGAARPRAAGARRLLAPAGSRGGRRRSWGSRSTGPTTCGPARSGARGPSRHRTPTAAARCSGGSTRSAGGCGPGTRAGRWSTGPGGS